uniref:BPTI-like C-terminal domain-containing protein n=1 Tax=Plectus sambesii TaxID=2011161 RepID=A0A914WDY0_9BILA
MTQHEQLWFPGKRFRLIIAAQWLLPVAIVFPIFQQNATYAAIPTANYSLVPRVSPSDTLADCAVAAAVAVLVMVACLILYALTIINYLRHKRSIPVAMRQKSKPELRLLASAIVVFLCLSVYAVFQALISYLSFINDLATVNLLYSQCRWRRGRVDCALQCLPPSDSRQVSIGDPLRPARDAMLLLLVAVVGLLTPNLIVNAQQEEALAEFKQPTSARRGASADINSVITDLGRLIVDNCPPMLCTGLDCAVATERNGCQLCACPIGSPARGCDPMPFVLWHDLMVKGCPNATSAGETRNPAQKVHRWFRRVNRFSNTDQCEPYVFPYCAELDYNLWRSPRTKDECEFYCYSFDEQRKRGII